MIKAFLFISSYEIIYNINRLCTLALQSFQFQASCNNNAHQNISSLHFSKHHGVNFVSPEYGNFSKTMINVPSHHSLITNTYLKIFAMSYCYCKSIGKDVNSQNHQPA